jgi:hypothetical protein
LGQQGVGGELGELGGPEVHGDDLLTVDPAGVDIGQRGGSGTSGGSVKGSDKDTVRVSQVGDGGTFGQEFGVGEDVEVDSGAGVGLELGGGLALSSVIPPGKPEKEILQ